MIDATEARKRSLEEVEEIKIGAQLIIDADALLTPLFNWIESKIYGAIGRGKFSVDIQLEEIYTAFPFAKTDKSWEMLLKDIGYQTVFVSEFNEQRKYARKYVTLTW